MSQEQEFQDARGDDRERRANHRDEVRNRQEAIDKARNMDEVIGQGVVVEENPELNPQLGNMIDPRDDIYLNQSPEPMAAPIIVVDPMQLILQQLQRNDEKQTRLFQELREDNQKIVQRLDEKINRNEQSCLDRTKVVQEITQINKERLDEVERKVMNDKESSSQAIDVLKRSLEEQIRDVKDAVEQMDYQSNNNLRGVEHGYRERRVAEEMKFGGRSDKPLLFLKELKDALGKQVNRWESVREIVKMYLIGPAKEWYLLHVDAIDNFATFENKFRQQYWSATIQSNLKHKLENGRYDPRSNLTPNEYLTSQRLLSTQFLCYDDELHFVIMISRHFNNRIQEAQINGGIVTIQRLSDVLESYRAKEEFNASTGRGNWQVSSFQDRNRSNEWKTEMRNFPNIPPNQNVNNALPNYRMRNNNFNTPRRFNPNEGNHLGRQNQMVTPTKN